MHRIGVNTNCYHGYSIEDALEGIHRSGFQYVELTATKGWTEHVFPTMSFEYLESIKMKIKELNLIPFAMSGHCNLMDSKRLKDFILNIKLAAFFGCEFIVSSVGEAHLEDAEQVTDERLVNHLNSLLPFLIYYDIKLVLETHGDHSTGVILDHIIGLVESPYVKINYDTANVIFYGDKMPEEDIDSCMQNIAYMHLKDKDGENKEWNFPALGKGYINFPSIFKKLEQAGNQCPFSIEIEFTSAGPKDLVEINQAVKESYDYLVKMGYKI